MNKEKKTNDTFRAIGAEVTAWLEAKKPQYAEEIVEEIAKLHDKKNNDYGGAYYEMLKECIYPYTNIKQINQERMRILMHLNAIKSDCDALAMDVEKTLRIKDTNEKDDFSPLTGKI